MSQPTVIGECANVRSNSRSGARFACVSACVRACGCVRRALARARELVHSSEIVNISYDESSSLVLARIIAKRESRAISLSPFALYSRTDLVVTLPEVRRCSELLRFPLVRFASSGRGKDEECPVLAQEMGVADPRGREAVEVSEDGWVVPRGP